MSPRDKHECGTRTLANPADAARASGISTLTCWPIKKPARLLLMLKSRCRLRPMSGWDDRRCSDADSLPSITRSQRPYCTGHQIAMFSRSSSGSLAQHPPYLPHPSANANGGYHLCRATPVFWCPILTIFPTQIYPSPTVSLSDGRDSVDRQCLMVGVPRL